MIASEHIFYIDIETVPQVYQYDDLDETWKTLWDEKMRFRVKEDVSAQDLYEKSGGVLAEFAKVICISVGAVTHKDGAYSYKGTSFYGDNEKTILEEFIALLNNQEHRPYLCAHNGKEFDYPFLCRRMITHSLALPKALQLQGKKPWEVPHLDTMEMWKFGDYKHYTSLNLLTHVLGIPSPKNDIKGSDVARVYYEEANLPRIVEYCEKDTFTVAALYHKMNHLPPLSFS